MRRYIQRQYYQVWYDPSKVHIDTLREIISEAWEAIPDSYIEGLFESWYDRCQAVIDANGGPTRY